MRHRTRPRPYDEPVSPHRSPVRLMALLGAVTVLAAACVSSEPPPADVPPVAVPAVTTMPATPPEPVTDDVVTAIEDYWEARDAAFAAGPEAGLAFVVANNHPLLPYTAEECREAWFDGEVPPGFAERNALLEGSIESDPGWQMVTGPLAGRDIGQGLFTMVVAFSYEGDLLRVADRVANVHLQVIGDDVSHFLLCEEPEVIVAAAPTTAATTPATSGGGTTTTPTSRPTTTPTQPTTLPPITATPQPTTPGGGGGTGTPTARPTAVPPGERPPGTGIDFCDEGDPGAQPVAGDYFLCPDDDIDNSRGEDAGSSEPNPTITGGTSG